MNGPFESVFCVILPEITVRDILQIDIYVPLYIMHIYTVSQEERSIFWEVIISAILRKKLYMYMYPIPNGLRDRAILLHSSRIVDIVTYLGVCVTYRRLIIFDCRLKRLSQFFSQLA
jgi:hypothetical protein